MYATVQELVDALTPEEKAGLCTGAAVPRLGLPALRVSGLHSQESAGGVCFPSACAAAASFDPEVARRMGAALGREARSGGAQLLDVPDVNLKRGPLSGRSADTWAEDPCLTGALAAAFLQGVQSAGVGDVFAAVRPSGVVTLRAEQDQKFLAAPSAAHTLVDHAHQLELPALALDCRVVFRIGHSS